MPSSAQLDELFQRAVSALDSADESALEQLLAAHPVLARDRLDAAGAWLRAQVGDALDGYFKQPYLVWFVAENPVRTGKLPANIAGLTSVIVRAMRRERVERIEDRLAYALGLVCSGRVARECGVDLTLIDGLIDAGAPPSDGVDALAAGNFAAARRLIERGGELTLAAAMCLDLPDIDRLLTRASAHDRQVALAAAAINGNARVLARLIRLGIDLDAYSSRIHPHATALHHAAGAGALDAVKVLVEAGANLAVRDRVYGATPLEWAEYGGKADVAAYLREKAARG